MTTDTPKHDKSSTAQRVESVDFDIFGGDAEADTADITTEVTNAATQDVDFDIGSEGSVAAASEIEFRIDEDTAAPSGIEPGAPITQSMPEAPVPPVAPGSSLPVIAIIVVAILIAIAWWLFR